MNLNRQRNLMASCSDVYRAMCTARATMSDIARDELDPAVLAMLDRLYKQVARAQRELDGAFSIVHVAQTKDSEGGHG